MKIVKSHINESPDTVCVQGSKVEKNKEGEYIDSWTCGLDNSPYAKYDSEDAYPFGIKNDNSEWDVTNGKMWVGYYPYNQTGGGEIHTSGRDKYKFAGRIWYNKGVISFWEYPKPQEIEEVIFKLAEALRKRNIIPEKTPDETLMKFMKNRFLIEVIKDKRVSKETGKDIWKTSGDWRIQGRIGADTEPRVITEFITIDEYKNKTSIQQFDKDQTIGDHEKSPMDKRKKPVPQGFGSRHPQAEQRAKERREKPFESLVKPRRLNENPDRTYARDKDLKWNDIPSHPFGMNVPRNEVLVGDNGVSHSQMTKATAFAYEDYEGRIWPEDRIIAFWQAPSKKTLTAILKRLLANPKLKQYGLSWSDYTNDFTFDLDEYYFSYIDYPENPNDLDATDEFDVKLKRPEHTISPINKKSNPKKGFGSDKYGKEKPLKYRQALQTSESYLNENPNTIMRPEAWEKRKDNYNYTPKSSEVVSHDLQESIPNVTFGYYGQGDKRRIFIHSGNSTHYDLFRDAARQLISKDERKGLKTNDVLKIVGSERGDLAGRLFPNQKVITFWTFPKDYNEFRSVIKDLNEKLKKNVLTKFQIDDSWLVEIPSGEYKGALDSENNKSGWGTWHLRAGHQQYIPISDYKGGYKRSNAEMNIKHTESPYKPDFGYLYNKGFRKYAGNPQNEQYYPRLK